IMKEPGDGQDAKLSGGDPSHG
ncbi:MAG: hypothetical protein K0R28_3876, partial [Paenibacillus sp.]|nr:hypothetical protein [Paenibacillus sp.]